MTGVQLHGIQWDQLADILEEKYRSLANELGSADLKLPLKIKKMNVT